MSPTPPPGLRAFSPSDFSAHGGKLIITTMDHLLLTGAPAGRRLPVSGYGRDIPTEYAINWCGRMRRVYLTQMGNSGTLHLRDWSATFSVHSA